jgi:hypothetical protein
VSELVAGALHHLTHAIAGVAYAGLVILAALSDQLVTLGVAAIGAAASIASAFIARGARRASEAGRVVVTHHDGDAVTVSNEDREQLAERCDGH